MDYLWSPWRYQYVTTADRTPGCVFCQAAVHFPVTGYEFLAHGSSAKQKCAMVSATPRTVNRQSRKGVEMSAEAAGNVVLCLLFAGLHENPAGFIELD